MIGCRLCLQHVIHCISSEDAGVFLRLHRAAHMILDSEDHFVVALSGQNQEDREFIVELMQYLLIHDGLAYESSDNVIGMGRAARLHGPARLRHISPEALMGMSPSDVRGRGNSLLKGILQLMKLVCGCAKLIHHHSGECGFGVRCKHQFAFSHQVCASETLPACASRRSLDQGWWLRRLRCGRSVVWRRLTVAF